MLCDQITFLRSDKKEHIMHASRLLHKQLEKSCPNIHQKRLDTLLLGVTTATQGHTLSIAGLGRGINNRVATKHNIKRMDRLVGNSKLNQEREKIYAYLVKQCVGNKLRPIIIVDWSVLSECGAHHFLRASIALEGRALTLYEECHPENHLYSSKYEKIFLDKLHALLPEGCRPIILTDAGFRNPWFNCITDLGWDYIGRIRGRTLIKLDHEAHWKHCKLSYIQATPTPRYLGHATLAKANPIHGHIHLVKQEKKHRVKKNLRGKKVKCSMSLKHAQRENEPWLLITSLQPKHDSANRIIKIYKLRMQIEESFRDAKSVKFGLGLSSSRTNSQSRYHVLLLMASLALFLLWLIGYCAKVKKLHFQYQANSIKHCNVLSIIFIGLEVVKRRITFFSIEQLKEAMNHLHAFEGNNYAD